MIVTIRLLCYNPHWRADPNFNGMPQPPPHPVSKPQPKIGPSPVEPNPDGSPEKRDFLEDDDSELLYASGSRPPSRQPNEMWRRPGWEPRPEYICSDELLETTGIKPRSRQMTRKYSPENPWIPRPPRLAPAKKPPEDR